MPKRGLLSRLEALGSTLKSLPPRLQLGAWSLPLHLVPLILLCGVCLWKALHAPFSDYAGYYFGSRELLHGNWQNAYDLGPLNSIIAGHGYPDIFVSYTPFPPFTSLVFAFFTLFPMGLSKLLFNAFSCTVFIITLIRTRRYLSLRPSSLFLIPFIFFIPTINNIFFGQSYMLLSCLLLEGYMAYRKGKVLASSLFWGLAILFKLVPGLIFIFLLLRKRYRDMAWLAGVCLILFLLSLWLNGAHSWYYYIFRVLPKMNKGELNDPFTYIFQSAFMLCKRAFVHDALLNPAPVWPSGFLFVFSMAFFKALIMSPAILVTLRVNKAEAPGRDALDFLSFGLWMMAGMLVSPNGSSYSLIVLLIPWLGISAAWSFWLIPGLLLFAACSIPVQRFGSLPLWGQFPRLYLLLLFFALTIRAQKRLFPDISISLLPSGWLTGIPAGTAARSSRFLAPALFFLLFFIFQFTDSFKFAPHPDTSSCLLKKEEHLFIYGLSIRNHYLVYSYRDPSGSHDVITDYPTRSASDSGLSIRNDQIWYQEKQLTHSPDRKDRPLLVDGNTLVYLSDKDRGVGFYTIRKLTLDPD